LDRIADIFGLIVVLAMIAVIVASKNTAGEINALGSSFTNAIKAATLR
jgi:hypothetical protein